MQTNKVDITTIVGTPLTGSKARVWGNNAAWVCTDCGELLGNRTDDPSITCGCGARYEIRSVPDRSGGNQGKATGVVRV